MFRCDRADHPAAAGRACFLRESKIEDASRKRFILRIAEQEIELGANERILLRLRLRVQPLPTFRVHVRRDRMKNRAAKRTTYRRRIVLAIAAIRFVQDLSFTECSEPRDQLRA